MTDLAEVWTGAHETLPRVLGQIDPVRSRAIAEQAIRDAAAEARHQATAGVPRQHRGDVGWQDLMIVHRWLTAYADALSLDPTPRRN